MPKLRGIYSTCLSLTGAALVIWGLIQLPTYSSLLTFFLFILLAVTAKSTTTHLMQDSSLVAVNSAISLACVPLFGPFAAAVVAAAAELSLWIISVRTDRPDWKSAIERLGVNVGMNGLAIFLGGVVFQQTAAFFGDDSVWGQIIAWLLAAVTADQVNLWLLGIIIYLAHGVKPIEVWKDNRWAIPINVVTMSAGGGLLHITVDQFDLFGMAIFFLPIIVSAYSYRVIVNNSKKQLEELEDLVALRTQDLAHAKEQLEQLHREKDAFIAVLTHDMRTPLTSIKGYGSILRDQDLPRTDQVHIMKVILRSQDTLLEIVNNMLEIQKLESGAPILLERSQFELDELVEVIVETLHALALEKSMALLYERPSNPVRVTADKKKVDRIITNLVANALKYTPHNGQVCVRVRQNGSYAITEVEDNGYGIPAEQLPYIFERFRRVPGHQRKATGTGLGLAIVKSLVEAHNGEITVQSEDGVGSTFTMKLPLQSAEDIEAENF
jgi:signal transduction histidine kinase